jgi:integrase/recombinase XerD
LSTWRGGTSQSMRQRRITSRVSLQTLKDWLRERAEWSPLTLLHRACIIDRFVDFLVREGSIASNPVAELRTKYLIKGSAPILRALLAPDPERALEALGQLPQFGSVLGDLMRNHVALMRTRGFRYDTNTRMFLRFDRFLQRHRARQRAGAGHVTALGGCTLTVFHAVDCDLLGRALAEARLHVDSSAAIRRPVPHPQWRFARGWHRRRNGSGAARRRWARDWRRPYIYKPEEVRALLDIARIRRRAHGSARSHCIRCSRSSTAPDYA